jgi:hypothetical protein
MATTIADFGGKIGGAAKDRAASRAARSAPPAGETTAPRARQPKPLRFRWWRDRTTGAFFATKHGDRAQRRIMELATRDEFDAFLSQPDYIAILTAAWEAAKSDGNVTNDTLRGAVNRRRSGPDYRGGVDMSPESFLAMFSPYGVEFGNWQNARAACLNQTTDALMDMAAVIGWAPSRLTFGGRLSLAFGARGHGKAAAHYEPGRRVINLTKTNGAGCLAHEWFHAFDHDAGAGEGRDFATCILGHNVNKTIMCAIPWAMKQRSIMADKTRSGIYFSKPEEMAARAFEAWVRSKADNDYLANITPVESFGPGPSRYPYPLADEMPAIDAAFRKLFAND